MPEGFTSRFSVRFDECGLDGSARVSALLRYTVETAFAHSTAKGFPLAWYDARGLYWLVRRARLELVRLVPYGGTVTVTTDVVGFRRIWARRRNVLRDADGASVGEIVMDWIFTDRAGQPAPVVPEMARAFPTHLQPFRVEHLALGNVPAQAVALEYVVPAHQADPRGHLNSAAYVDLLDDALITAGVDVARRPAIYELEFLRPSLPGDVLRRTLWSVGGTWMMAVATAEGAPVASALHRAPTPLAPPPLPRV